METIAVTMISAWKLPWAYAEAHAHRGDDEGKFADLRQCDCDGKGHAQRLAEELDHNEGGQGFADEDDSERGEDEGPVADERGGVEQHPHGNEEEDGEGVAHGQGLWRQPAS